MSNILIIDDLVPLETQNYIENNILNNKDLPWFFYESTCSEKHNHKNIVEGPQFVHNFFNIENGVNSKYFKIPNLILDLLKKQYDDVDLKEYRIKTNLQLRSQISDVNKHTTPHIDYDFEHQVFLYYVNDCDGDTFLFDDNLEVIERVSPKKGRIICFDGKWLHASSLPVKSNYRCVINFNIKVTHK